MPNISLDTTFTPEEERQVLIQFYHSTSGHQWCNNTGWLNSSVHHCSWNGITCYENAPYVKTVQLGFNKLNGSLPDNLWKLRNLLALCPAGNPSLGGQFLEFIHSNMTKLLTLDISFTSYTGQIPSAITKLVRLQKLFACDMFGEGLYGTLPKDLGNMSELRYLSIGGNKFNESVPMNIRNLTKLVYLDLQNAPGLLSGDVHALLSLKSIECLYVSGLTLNGKFPDALPCGLRVIVLPGNKIRGNLPSKLKCKGNSSLTLLNLQNNMLDGDIPGIFFTAVNLTHVNLSRNNFTSINNGTILKHSEGITPPLQSLSLAENPRIHFDMQSFDKYIFQTYTKLQNLNLKNCGIQAKLSGLWWYYLSLLTLDLSNNQFYGNIPGIYGPNNLGLTHLDLSNNNITGSIHRTIYSAINLQYFNITGNLAMFDGGEMGDAMNPTFLRTNFQNMQKINTRVNFTCPQIHFTFDGGHVHLDPSYYGYIFCVCDDGHYGTNGICHKCMTGAVCKKPKIDSWKDLNKSVMIMNEGFWPMPKPENVSHLRKCFSPKACNPSGDCSCSGIGITRLNKPITHCNSTCLCSHGGTGRFCSRCFDGFYKTGQICFQCAEDRPKLYISLPSLIVSMLILWCTFSGSGFYSLAAYAALAIQELLMIILVFLGFLPGWAFGLNLLMFVLYITSKRKELHALIKIATFYVQLLDCMISSSNIWPEKVLSTQHYFSALWNLHFTDLSCDFTILFTPVGKFLSILFLPMACIILTWLYYAAKTIYQKCRAASADPTTQGIELKFKCRRITIMILNFTYFPIVTATISALTPCEKDSGISYMPSTPWVECSSGIYNTLYFLGWASLLLYVVSVP